jgi:hypothetical protein
LGHGAAGYGSASPKIPPGSSGALCRSAARRSRSALSREHLRQEQRGTALHLPCREARARLDTHSSQRANRRTARLLGGDQRQDARDRGSERIGLRSERGGRAYLLRISKRKALASREATIWAGIWHGNSRMGKVPTGSRYAAQEIRSHAEAYSPRETGEVSTLPASAPLPTPRASRTVLAAFRHSPTPVAPMGPPSTTASRRPRTFRGSRNHGDGRARWLTLRGGADPGGPAGLRRSLRPDSTERTIHSPCSSRGPRAGLRSVPWRSGDKPRYRARRGRR